MYVWTHHQFGRPPRAWPLCNAENVRVPVSTTEAAKRALVCASSITCKCLCMLPCWVNHVSTTCGLGGGSVEEDVGDGETGGGCSREGEGGRHEARQALGLSVAELVTCSWACQHLAPWCVKLVLVWPISKISKQVRSGLMPKSEPRTTVPCEARAFVKISKLTTVLVAISVREELHQ